MQRIPALSTIRSRKKTPPSSIENSKVLDSMNKNVKPPITDKQETNRRCEKQPQNASLRNEQQQEKKTM